MFSLQQHCTPQCRKWLSKICSICVYHKSVLLYAYFSDNCMWLYSFVAEFLIIRFPNIKAHCLTSLLCIHLVPNLIPSAEMSQQGEVYVVFLDHSRQKCWDGSLHSLYGPSPISIINFYMYLLCTSFYSTILHVKQLLIVKYFILYCQIFYTHHNYTHF